MPSNEDDRRIIGICNRCESIYTCQVLVDGAIRPIGSYACSCGCEDFIEFDD